IQDYNQALKINPNYADAYYNRGLTRDDLGDKQAAIQDYNQALKINPNYADAYNNRGILRAKLGDKQGAIQDYNQALKINPNDAYAYLNRGLTRYDLGDKQGAIDDFNQALKINPNYAKAYYNRGNAYATLGDKFQARSDFQQAAKIYQQQGKNENYQDALNKEQFQIYDDLTQTRAELNSTCTSTIKLCTFTIENQKISVRLTPEYDRLFQANNPQIQSHFQSLKDALKVISQNSQLPVFIYNSQGQERYMRLPQ
ncbi:MAG: tetratricopeptide repeat protein, partial [Nostocales cyanobacterium ELA583]